MRSNLNVNDPDSPSISPRATGNLKASTYIRPQINPSETREVIKSTNLVVVDA